MFLEILGLEAF